MPRLSDDQAASARNSDRIGKPAVDFRLDDIHGQPHSLADFRSRWLLLVFHRHLGWLPCREHLTQLREAENELQALEVAVAVVTFDGGPLAEAYVRESKLSWPLLLDRERTLYRAYGMLRASALDLFGPSSFFLHLKLLAKGRRLQKPGSDVVQRGGDVLIDPAGTVRLQHVGSGPADRPSVASILNLVRDAAASS